jgi:hypothetical protein
MHTPQIKRTVGSPVSADRFWDRETELALLTQYLDEGAHVLIVSPRRIGKTSLMLEAARKLRDRFLCLQMDLEKAHSPEDVVAELGVATLPFSSVWIKTREMFSRLLGSLADRLETVQVDDLRVTLRSALTRADWQVRGDRLLELLAEADPPVVVFMDEVPILVNRILLDERYEVSPEGRRQADAFLSWLRAASMRHQGRIRLVVTGSIGLEPIARRAGLSATLNTLTPFAVGPWPRETALGCLAALASEYKLALPPEQAGLMLDLIGVCVPHYVQMFFDHVYRACRLEGRNEVSEDLVRRVYETSMLGTRGHAELSHLEERLKMVLGPVLHPLALDLLTEAAVSRRLTAEAAERLAREDLPPNQRRGDELREILAILEHDGYLTPAGADEYVFVSKLLREWWQKRFGFGFIPACGRSRGNRR